MMNETLKTIKSRRSYKKFQPTQIKDEEIQMLMEAAIAAPTAMFQQKWHFSIVQNKEVLDNIIEAAREGMMKSGMDFMVQRAKDPSFNPIHNAPTVIIVSGAENTKFVDIDCALAAENILLAAESLNIGAGIMTSSEMWFTSPKGEELKKTVGIPDNYKHVCSILLGYKAPTELPDRTRKTDVYNYVK